MSERVAEHPIDPLFLARWSRRAFAEKPVSEQDLASLFEAARWAPSAYNYQPWRFVYALRGDAHWQTYLESLIAFNAGWAAGAGALIYVLSDRLITPPGAREAVEAASASFDAGAAWAHLALQAAKQGLSAHALGGFDPAAATAATGAGDRFKVEVAVAVGWPGDAAYLPDALRAREKPSLREPVSRIAFAGRLIAGNP